MNLADLSDKIATRITSDTGSGGLSEVGGTATINGVQFDVPIPGTDVPYLIVTFPECMEHDAFTPDGVIITVEFELVTDRRQSNFSVDSVRLDRLRSLFHRWKPTLATGYSAEEMGRITGTTQHDAEQRHYIEQYRIGVWWNTIGPV